MSSTAKPVSARLGSSARRCGIEALLEQAHFDQEILEDLLEWARAARVVEIHEDERGALRAIGLLDVDFHFLPPEILPKRFF